MVLSIVFSCSALAHDVEVGGIYYNLDKTNKTAEVTYKGSSLNSYSGVIVIPSSITVNKSNYDVTAIGSGAFSYSRGLTSVTIPNSVTSIGDQAFDNCTGLTSVTIPNSVTSIGDYAFSSCTDITSITITNSVTSIGDGAFYGCSGLTSITIPNSVTSIGDYAFSWCSGLTSITIPNSVTSIGGSAFEECSGLTSVTIPNSVTSIGDCAFFGCTGINQTIIVNDMFVFLPTGYEGHYSIPENISTIIGGAFSGCSGLTSVTIPNSVTSIGDNAFNGCSKLEIVYCCAESVPSTGDYVFKGMDIEKATLHVPASAIEAYKTTTPWSEFGTIKAIEETVGIESVKDRGIAIQSAGGFINISGLDNNEKVSFYGIDGKSLGSATAINGTTSFAAQSGSIVVAKIGKENIKIAVE